MTKTKRLGGVAGSQFLPHLGFKELLQPVFSGNTDDQAIRIYAIDLPNLFLHAVWVGASCGGLRYIPADKASEIVVAEGWHHGFVPAPYAVTMLPSDREAVQKALGIFTKQRSPA